jgi:hypothetical protein
MSSSQVNDLVDLFSVERADNYTTWIEVGLCLHKYFNEIDLGLNGKDLGLNGKDLGLNGQSEGFETFSRFSRKSPRFNKYFEEEYVNFWNDQSTRIGPCEFTIASLHFWAQADQPQGYSELIANYVNQFIEKNKTHLVSVKNRGVWWQFNGVRWIQIETVIDLLDPIFAIHPVILRCEAGLIDPDFEARLDSNCDLLGFQNGVYDLSRGVFRVGKPEDYVSLSTGYDYLDSLDETVKKMTPAIDYHLANLLGSKKETMIELLSTFLWGRKRKSKFQLWSGEGNGGKSVAVQLHHDTASYINTQLYHIWTGGESQGGENQGTKMLEESEYSRSKIIEFFQLTLGQYARQIPAIRLSNTNRVCPELAQLSGRRFCYMNVDEPLTPEFVRNWTVEDNVFARKLYCESIKIRPDFNLVFCSKRMQLDSKDEKDLGFERRLRPFEFSGPIEYYQDSYLTRKFNELRPAFMSLLLSAYRKGDQITF